MAKAVVPNSFRFESRIPRRGDTNLLLEPRRAASRLLFTVGWAVYEFEKYARSNYAAKLEVSVEQKWDLATLTRRLGPLLERLLRNVLLVEAEVFFSRASTQFQAHTPTDRPRQQAVCLFSGGVDSLCGLLDTRNNITDLSGVFASHLHQSRVISIVRAVEANVVAPLGVRLYEMPAPAVETLGYSQTRGFLYMLLGAAVAAALGAKRLVVSEVGPTMYQPQYSPVDSVTMTTHPFVVERAQEAIRTIGRSGIVIETPYEDKTKAEVMASCTRPELLPATHSCVSQRLELHDGTCHGCVVRRLGALAAGVPDVPYARNPISDGAASAGNLLALLEFCSFVLTDRSALPGCATQIIETFRKWDLFERFALDNLAAIHRVKSQSGPVTPAVERIYLRTVKKIGKKRLTERLRLLRGLATPQKGERQSNR